MSRIFFVMAKWIRILQVHSKIFQQIIVSPLSETLKYLIRLWNYSGIVIIPSLSKFLRCAVHTALEISIHVRTFRFLKHLATQPMDGGWCRSVRSLNGNKKQGLSVNINCVFHSPLISDVATCCSFTNTCVLEGIF